ncbi:S41 family peptidase [Flaviaesturariibacter amylovorans]|uniref:S41 family peptidase n=1 Tax=Flaviaesturariibacter amylovorans TaxID=1084520 RepID=A0ABP8GXA6_9BACT
MQNLKKSFLAVAVLATGMLFSCKKTDVAQNNLAPASPDAPAGPVTASDRDTAAGYSRDIYLWNTQIPSSFSSSAYADLGAMMTGLRQYSTEPGFSGPVDKWSFAVKKTDWDATASGSAGDFGLNVFFRTANDLRVKHVEPASPAGRAGVRRGWQIVKINGSSNISTNNTSFVSQAVFQSTSGSFTFVKPDNSQVTLNLNAGVYQERPVVLSKVINHEGRKVGYFVFNSFMGDTNAVFNEFRNSFSNFASAGIQDLVVDLRYNGGGYVTMQEKLANYIAPSSASGNLMMRQQFNARNSQYNENTNFSKLGSLNLPRVFFIVSKSTASASELLINNLKPYMNVVLVGPSPTHGKPVGFFPIPVKDWYIFPVSFKTVNKNGEGSYFGGIPVNAIVPDGLDKDWGDPSESALNAALQYSVTGAFGMAGRSEETRTLTQDPQVRRGNEKLDEHTFKGEIDTRGMRPKKP